MNTALLTANLLVCLLLTIAGVPANAGVDPSQCPEGWQNILYRCYYFSNSTATWMQAWEKCDGFRAHLVSLETFAEASKMKSYLDNHNVGTNNYWTSGSNDNTMGKWYWFGTMSKIFYFNNCDNEDIIADVNPDGRCLSVSVACGAKWLPEDCSNKNLKYICEKDANLAPSN